MAAAFDQEQIFGRWDKGQGRLHLLGRSERVARAVDEQSRDLELGEVGGAQLLRAAGRVQRVSEQQEAIDERRMGGGEHARLASAVRMAAEEYAPGDERAHGGYGLAKALAILGGAPEGRSLGTRLAERQVAPQDSESGIGESARYGDQQLRLAVGSGAVGEHQGVAAGIGRRMQESADRFLSERRDHDFILARTTDPE